MRQSAVILYLVRVSCFQKTNGHLKGIYLTVLLLLSSLLSTGQSDGVEAQQVMDNLTTSDAISAADTIDIPVIAIFSGFWVHPSHSKTIDMIES